MPQTVRSSFSPSSVACGATFPLEGEGYYGYPAKLRDRADLEAKQEVEHKKFAPPQKPSPSRGKVAPQATDEGETGESNREMEPSAIVAFSFARGEIGGMTA